MAGLRLCCCPLAACCRLLCAFALAFVLFRLFDIWKPWPVSWAEDNLQGGLGVMMDDIVAGLMAGVLVAIAALLSWHL